MTVVFIGWLGISAVQAATLNISFAAQGDNYTNMVRDAKIRGNDTQPLADANLGAGRNDSDRFYAYYKADGVTLQGRLNNFVQWFDVSSIPVGSTINSAYLTNYFGNSISIHDHAILAVKLSRLLPGKGWAEGVSLDPATDGSVTWNWQVGFTTAWATPGATDATDIDLSTTQTFDVPGNADQVTPTPVGVDITAWVQGWVNTPTNNTGMVMWGGTYGDVGGEGRYFHVGVKENSSRFSLINPNQSTNTFSVSFATQNLVNYTLQYKDALSDVTWNNGASTAGVTDGAVKTLKDLSATPSARIYRVVASHPFPEGPVLVVDYTLP